MNKIDGDELMCVPIGALRSSNNASAQLSVGSGHPQHANRVFQAGFEMLPVEIQHQLPRYALLNQRYSSISQRTGMSSDFLQGWFLITTNRLQWHLEDTKIECH